MEKCHFAKTKAVLETAMLEKKLLGNQALKEQSYYRQEIDSLFNALREETEALVTKSLGKFWGKSSTENLEMSDYANRDYTDEYVINDVVVKEVGRGVDLIEKGLKQSNKITPQWAKNIKILRTYLANLAEI